MLGVGATLRHIATKGSGGDVPVPFSMSDLFANNVDGIWLDPSVGAASVSAVKNHLPYNATLNGGNWANVNASTTSGLSDPFGQSNAVRITDNVANSYHMKINQNLETPKSGYVTLSCYLKAESLTGVRITYQQSTFNFTEITNLDGTPTLDQTDGRTITSVGNDWFLFTHRFYAYEAVSAVFYIMTLKNGSFVYSGTGESVLVCAPQVNIGYDSFPDFALKFNSGDISGDLLSDYPNHNLFADSSGNNAVVAYGNPIGKMLDSSGNANHTTQSVNADRPILVSYPRSGRRNILPKSQFLDWTETNIDAGVFYTNNGTDDHLPDPDGNNDATFLTVDGTASSSKISKTQHLRGGHYWLTMYVKKPSVNGSSYVYLTSGNNETWFNLSTATIGHDEHSDSFVTSAGNGWYRIGVKDNHSTGNISLAIGLSDLNNSTSATTAKQIHYYGVQLESGASYTDAQKVIENYYVTENGYANIAGIQFYDGNHLEVPLTTSASPMTFLAGVDHVSRLGYPSSSFIYNSDGNPIGISNRLSADGRIGFYDGSSKYGTSDSFEKQVITYKIESNDAEVRVNGSQIYTNSNQNQVSLSGTSTLGGASTSSELNGVIYQFLIRVQSTTAGEISNAETYFATKTGESF
jgi:hypothetical protein